MTNSSSRFNVVLICISMYKLCITVKEMKKVVPPFRTLNKLPYYPNYRVPITVGNLDILFATETHSVPALEKRLYP